MDKKTTIKDVAKTLGISVSTVSRVMNGQDRVSAAMRKKVLDTARKLNYVPSLAAVSVVRKQTKIIAALLPDLSTPLYASILDGIEESACARGYHTLAVLTHGSHDEELRFLGSMVGHSVDGVIMIPESPALSAYTAFPKPIVFIDRIGDEDGFDSVVVDNFRGAYLAAEHLISRGHSKIAIIASEREFSSGHDRVLGFEQALRNKSIRIKPQYICIGGGTEKDGYAGAFRLMNLDDPPTAIFAASEPLCRAAIIALHDLKLRLGKDISLIGFEDSDLNRAYSPGVTVVSRATGDLGKIGANMLIEKITSQSAPSGQQVSLPVRLIIRDSVRTIGD
jgi:DNA-binding LacI/PurR family transcriptional regulator